MESEKKAESVKCPECGFENLLGAKFCSSCGLSFKPAAKGRFDAIVALLLVGSFYLFVSLVFNAIMQQVWYFSVPAAVSGLLGLYAAYRLNRGEGNAAAFASAATSVGVGFAVTFLIFLIGLDIMGVFGPAWVIFVATGYWLYRSRGRAGAPAS